MEKWGKNYVQFMCFIFHFSPHLAKKSFHQGGLFCYSSRKNFNVSPGILYSKCIKSDMSILTNITENKTIEKMTGRRNL